MKKTDNMDRRRFAIILLPSDEPAGKDEKKMIELKKGTERIPENYAPKTKPEILRMAEELSSEKVLDTVVIQDVEFTILEKSKTIYAGAYAVAPDLESEPDFTGCLSDQEVINLLRDSVTPDRLLVLSIDYSSSDRPNAMLRGQETTSYEQPDTIHVIEAEPTLLIKVKSTDAAWALTKQLAGEENPQWHMAPLFGLIRRIFCEDGPYHYNYEFNGCRGKGNEETEYYCFNGDKYVTVPVKKKG